MALVGTYADRSQKASVSDSARQYFLGLLFFVYMLNLVDRQVIYILAEPIKRDLGLADWQIGMIMGLAFALFYSVVSVPIARIAEKHDRPTIIAVSLALWSLCTALSGLAQGFVQLLLSRMGTGMGEAGCAPAAHALIADMTPREKRASALAVFSMGAPIGAFVGMAMGGLVADAYGWRMAFIVCGLPGLLLAIVVRLTMAEPRRLRH